MLHEAVEQHGVEAQQQDARHRDRDDDDERDVSPLLQHAVDQSLASPGRGLTCGGTVRISPSNCFPARRFT